jgi:hypothetical protein
MKTATAMVGQKAVTVPKQLEIAMMNLRRLTLAKRLTVVMTHSTTIAMVILMRDASRPINGGHSLAGLLVPLFLVI